VIYCFAARTFCNSLMENPRRHHQPGTGLFGPSSLLKALFQTLETGATIVHGVSGAGYWSLVLPSVVLAPVKTAAWWRSCSWGPRWTFSRTHARNIFRYCIPGARAELMQSSTSTRLPDVGTVLGAVLPGDIYLRL